MAKDTVFRIFDHLRQKSENLEKGEKPREITKSLLIECFLNGKSDDGHFFKKLGTKKLGIILHELSKVTIFGQN